MLKQRRLLKHISFSVVGTWSRLGIVLSDHFALYHAPLFSSCLRATKSWQLKALSDQSGVMRLHNHASDNINAIVRLVAVVAAVKPDSASLVSYQRQLTL